MVSNSSLKAIHDDIQGQLERSNESASKWLEGKYKENLQLMERRLKHIRLSMDDELSKHKKLSEDVRSGLFRATTKS